MFDKFIRIEGICVCASAHPQNELPEKFPRS